MKKLIVSICLLYGTLSAYAIILNYYTPKWYPSPAPLTSAPKVDDVKLARAMAFTVLISNEGLGHSTRGTGVVIAEDQVLTCAHMVDPDAEMWIYTYPLGRVRIGHVVFMDRLHDLAIIELLEPIKLSHYAHIQPMHKIGESVILIGNIKGYMKWFVSYGMVSADFLFYIETNALSRGGNSGGPWLNAAGEVIALTDWGIQDNKGNEVGIAGGVSGAAIADFLMLFDQSQNPLNELQGVTKHDPLSL